MMYYLFRLTARRAVSFTKSELFTLAEEVTHSRLRGSPKSQGPSHPILQTRQSRLVSCGPLPE